MVACRLRSSSLVLTSLVAASCGGGGGGAAQEVGPTVVAATFPPARCLTTERTLTVRGKATNPARLASIDVGGVGATTSDRFATWQATVGLGDATTALDVVPVDRSGTQLLAPGVTAEVEKLPTDLQALALDPNRGQLLVGDSFNADGVVALDLASGRFVEVSGPERGAGDALPNLSGIAVDAASDCAYAVTRPPTQIVKIDLASGDRSVLSDENGANLKIAFAISIVVDSAHARVLVVDSGKKAVVAVKTSDGTRAVFSDATHGTGPAFVGPNTAHLLASKGRLLVVDVSARALLSLDLANGNRTIVADDTHGSGGILTSLRGVTVDDAIGEALLVDSASRSVWRVNLTTGDRSVVSGPGRGDGEAFRSINAIASFADGSERAFVSDDALVTVLGVDVASGDREVLDRVRIGGASPLGRLFTLGVDAVSGRVLAATFLPDARVVEIDSLTGEHAELSSATRGGGPPLGFVSAIASAPSRNAALVLDIDRVLSIDRDSGDRTTVADDHTGSGSSIQFASALAVDDARGAAYVADQDVLSSPELLRIDLDSGVRSLVSGAFRGDGPNFGCIQELAITADGTEAIAVSTCNLCVLRVDLATGDRSVVSGRGIGGGPDFEALDEGLALVPDGIHAFVADANLGVVRVDLTTGARTIVSGVSLGHGPAAGFGLRAAADGEHLFAMPANGGGLLEIDPATGDRAIVSY